jgi:hypothetical protein
MTLVDSYDMVSTQVTGICQRNLNNLVSSVKSKERFRFRELFIPAVPLLCGTCDEFEDFFGKISIKKFLKDGAILKIPKNSVPHPDEWHGNYFYAAPPNLYLVVILENVWHLYLISL